MKRIIFPLIMTSFLGLMAVSCNQNAQSEQESQSTESSLAGKDSSILSGFEANTKSEEGKEPPVKVMTADNMKNIAMDGKDLEVTVMYAGSTVKQLYCKTMGREEESRYYFNSNGNVSMLDETKKDMAGEYVQQVFIYVADSLQVAVQRKAPTRAGLEKVNPVNFVPEPGDPRADAVKTSKKGQALLAAKE